MTTDLNGRASMKHHRDLGVTQRKAWHLAHRLRTTWEQEDWTMEGPVEVGETYMGGREKNKHARKKLKIRGGTAGKMAVVGALSPWNSPGPASSRPNTVMPDTRSTQ